jgi:hypothetical protein
MHPRGSKHPRAPRNNQGLKIRYLGVGHGRAGAAGVPPTPNRLAASPGQADPRELAGTCLRRRKVSERGKVVPRKRRPEGEGSRRVIAGRQRPRTASGPGGSTRGARHFQWLNDVLARSRPAARHPNEVAARGLAAVASGLNRRSVACQTAFPGVLTGRDPGGPNHALRRVGLAREPDLLGATVIWRKVTPLYRHPSAAGKGRRLKREVPSTSPGYKAGERTEKNSSGAARRGEHPDSESIRWPEAKPNRERVERVESVKKGRE